MPVDYEVYVDIAALADKLVQSALNIGVNTVGLEFFQTVHRLFQSHPHPGTASTGTLQVNHKTLAFGVLRRQDGSDVVSGCITYNDHRLMSPLLH